MRDSAASSSSVSHHNLHSLGHLFTFTTNVTVSLRPNGKPVCLAVVHDLEQKVENFIIASCSKAPVRFSTLLCFNKT